MTPQTQPDHVRFIRAVRGALIAEAAFSDYLVPTLGWSDVRTEWMDPPRPRSVSPFAFKEEVGTQRGPAAEPSRSELEGEKRRGTLERIFLTPDLYYHSLPPGTQTPAMERAGALSWRYVGQQVFSTRPERARRGFTPEKTRRRPTFEEDPDAYFGVGRAIRVDGLGRRWTLAAVDAAAAADRVREYDERVKAEFGRAEVNEAELPARSDLEMPYLGFLMPRLVHPKTWTEYYCTNGADDDATDDYLGDRLEELSSLNERARKVVMVNATSSTSSNDNGASGTMVDSRWVLTAAHSVSSSGNALNPATLDICSLGNLGKYSAGGDTPECNSASTSGGVVLGPNWTGATDWEEDYAVVQTSNSPGVGWMALSSASDTYIDNYYHYHRGYPDRIARSCSYNQFSSGTTNTGFYGGEMYGASGEIESTPGDAIKYDISTADGCSGGPMYYCPRGCDDGHYITGVLGYVDYDIAISSLTVGSMTATIYTGGGSGGPKANSIRTWVINNTP